MKGSIAALLSVSVATIFGTCATASADPIADKSRAVGTVDGWELQITKVAESVDRQPNLADSPFTHEGFVSLTAAADITGSGRTAVNSGTVQLGYQLGCQADVTNGLTAGLAAMAGPNVMVTVAPAPGVAVGAGAQLMPSLAVNIKPGTITSIPLGTKMLAGAHGSISVDQVEIKIDGCLGQVSLRSFAIVTISTATADSSTAVYGDPMWL
ncbi:MspA family porin [Nocardia sp. CA-107356]|uniref:MspA family porin n=1 Tax=Nocardia sp. CA-107356 TaxID=3239972 RepID=UPI003D92602E